ncbi:MAG: major royal jelly protein [Gemmataceae bacterium]|nr:major royal jelly protein [Gemmataceae bacterium]
MRPVLLSLVFAAGVVSGGLASGGAADEPPDPKKLPRAHSAGKLELVGTFDGAMPTGVTVSKAGRIFLTFPRWGDAVEATVGELTKDGKVVPFPDAEINRLDPKNPAGCLLTVQSAVVDPLDRLWLCDTGTVNMGPVQPGGAKLLCVDLGSNKVVKTLPLGEPGVLKTTYLNDIRFDLRRGEEGLAYVTDSSATGPNGIVVIDLKTGKTWRKLTDHPSTKADKNFMPIVEGRVMMERPGAKDPPKHLKIGADGIALSHDGQKLFYCPLASRRLYCVATDALADPDLPDETAAAAVEDLGDRGFASDGLEVDDKGRLYLTNYEHNAILRRSPDGRYETLVYDNRVLWPDTMSIGQDGFLYFTANQLHRQPRFHGGKDQRIKPYVLFKVKIEAGPVLLKK